MNIYYFVYTFLSQMYITHIYSAWDNDCYEPEQLFNS